MPCTRWKLPGYRNPKAEPDHLHYICDTGDKRFPRNRLLPSLWRIYSPAHTKVSKRGLARKYAEGEPPPLHPHPHSRYNPCPSYHTTTPLSCQQVSEEIFIFALEKQQSLSLIPAEGGIRNTEDSKK